MPTMADPLREAPDHERWSGKVCADVAHDKLLAGLRPGRESIFTSYRL